MERPKLRFIEAIPADEKGEGVVYLRDPQNPGGNVLAVSPGALIVISMFDGRKNLSDIQTAMSNKYGYKVELDEIGGLITKLDEALFLDSKKYREHKLKIEREFASSGVREPYLAGLSYPDDKQGLEEWFVKFIEGAAENGAEAPKPGNLRGIISPHIDYPRGGVSYARAYSGLANGCDADTYIIFGTSHYAESENPFILTRKDFRTPLGLARTDGGLIDRLERACGWNLYDGEISHRTEHSIEFQVAFLQHMLKGRQDFTILPVLCNSFYTFVRDGRSPAEDGTISKFLDAVREIVSGMGDRVFIIAGADMAHVGLKFGDSEAVNEDALGKIRERDMLSLAASERIDAEGFYRTVEEEKDWRKVCGLSPIYAALSTIDATSGKLLDYGQALEPETGSVVSYASMGFYS